MYLSRLKLDVSKRKVLIALENPNIIHGILAASQSGNERILWRVDKFQGSYYLYIVTADQLNTHILEEQLGSAQEPCISKNFDTVLAAIHNGSTYHFRLTAAPAWSSKELGDSTRGKKLSCLSDQKRQEWLIRQGESHGFKVNPGEFLVTNIKQVRFRKKSSGLTVQFQSVTFEGVLQVTDVQAFKTALEKGIGREKAYGQGLLTIAR